MTLPEAGPLGVFGGTFDPIHYGHLRLAETAREALGLTRVRLIPAGQPPHRATPGAAGAHRLAMARLAAASNPAFEVDPAEVEAAQASYTILSLERLRAELGPRRPLVLLLGVDAFLGLPGWHRWTALLDLAHIAVAHRPGFPIDAASLPPALAVLATYRNAIARGASPREVSSVAEHIAFLIALWSPDDKPKQRILQQIQENLS